MSNRGWAYFLVGLLISSFLGGALRVYFSPHRVRKWVEEIMVRKQPKFNLDFAEANITLANGWFPGVAVEFIDLKVVAKDTCITGSEIHIDRLNVPVRAGGLFSPRVSFGLITADQINFRYLPKKCDSQLNIPSVVAGRVDQALPQELENFMSRRWRREMANTFNILSGVYVENFRYYHLEGVDPLWQAWELEAYKGSALDSLDVDFSFEPGFDWVGDVSVGRLRGQLELTPESIEFRGRGNVKEGQYKALAHWKLLDSVVGFEMEIRDMPAGPLFRLLERWQLFRWPQAKLSNEWFRCQLSGQGHSSAWQDILVSLNACGFYGELGDVLIRDTELRLLRGEAHPISASLEGIKVAALEGLNEFSQVGFGEGSILSGEFSLEKPDHYNLEVTVSEPKLRLNQWSWAELVGQQVQLAWSRRDWQSRLTLTDWVQGGTPLDLELQIEKDWLKNSSQISWKAGWPHRTGLTPKLPKSLDWVDVTTQGSLVFVEDQLNTVKAKFAGTTLVFEGLRWENWDAELGWAASSGHWNLQAETVRGFLGHRWRILGRLSEVTGWDADLYKNFKWKSEFGSLGRWVVNPLEFSSRDDQRASARFVGRGYETSIDEGLFLLLEGKKVVQRLQIFGTLTEPRIEVLEP